MGRKKLKIGENLMEETLHGDYPFPLYLSHEIFYYLLILNSYLRLKLTFPKVYPFFFPESSLRTTLKIVVTLNSLASYVYEATPE